MFFYGKWFGLGLYFDWISLDIQRDPFSIAVGPLYIRLGRWDADKE